MKEKQQLDCHLYCRAAASLEESVAKDLLSEDKGIEEIINEQKKAEDDSECDI